MHVCRTVDRFVGHPRPLRHWCRVSLPGPPMCLGAQDGIEAQRQPFVGVPKCGRVNVSWWSSKQAQRGFTAVLLHAFRVPCLTTIIDSRSLECQNTYTPARRVALFCEHFVAPTVPAGCRSWMFFALNFFVQQILIHMLFISIEISSHFSCLLTAVPLSILFIAM